MVNNDLDDTTCKNYGSGNPSVYPCSFRGAVLEADSTPDDDTIIFASSLTAPIVMNYHYTLFEVNAGSGKLTITGNGAVSLDFNQSSSTPGKRFEIRPGADVWVEDLIIQGGGTAAFINEGILTLSNVMVATSNNGIFNSGELIVGNGSVIVGNNDHGIYNYSAGTTWVVGGSIVSGNKRAGIVNDGGKTYVFDSKIVFNDTGFMTKNRGTSAVNFSLLDNNSGTSVYVQGFGSNVVVNSSTMSNSSSGLVAQSRGIAKINDSEIIHNTGRHGGLLSTSAGLIEIYDSIVQGNTANGIENLDARLHMERTQVIENGENGIYQNTTGETEEGEGGEEETTATATVIDSDISRNELSGVWQASNSTMDLNNTTITFNGDRGIYSWLGTRLTGHVLDVSNNASTGIASGGSSEIAHSNISNNGGDGVTNHSDGIMKMNSNTISNNAGSGFQNADLGFAHCPPCTPVAYVSETQILNNQTRGVTNRYGEVYMDTVTIDGNGSYARTNEGGAGILLDQGATMEMIDSTISNNFAPDQGHCLSYPSAPTGGGGAMVIDSYLSLLNTTVSGNTAEGVGGGIYSIGPGAAVDLVNTTISNNTADSDDNSTTEMGGGLHNDGGNVRIKNSLVLDNHNPEAPECSGAINSSDYNVIGDSTGCSSFRVAANDMLDANVTLGALQLNGGQTQTQALIIDPNSPAIDFIPLAACTDLSGLNVGLDQRGELRSSMCDAGAYEVEDADDDLLPDDWENIYGTDATTDDSGDDPDGDGYTNYEEYLASSDPKDTSSTPVVDTDGDGTIDEDDAFPNDIAASVDSDGDGYPDAWNTGYSETDSTTGLALDAFPLDATEWTDTDGDGYGDNAADAFPTDPTEWADTDGDLVGDNSDACPSEDATGYDADGDGCLDDTDGDGYTDNVDACPSEDSTGYDADGDGCLDDTDGDGYTDNVDVFPSDSTEWVDTDGDGYGDNSDVFPSDSTEWIDTDGDGYGDNGDAFPSDPTEWADADMDGVGDNSDLCAGTTDYTTVDADGCSDYQRDTDGDGLSDGEEINGDYGYVSDETLTDTDGDGLSDYEEATGTYTTDPTSSDTDGDGYDDYLEQETLGYDPTATALIIHNGDSVNSAAYGTWSGAADTYALATDTTTYMEGAGSIVFDADVGASTANYAQTDVNSLTSVDLSSYSSGSVKFWVYIPEVTNFSRILFILGNDGGNYNYWFASRTADGSFFSQGWNLIEVNMASAGTSGTVNLSAIDYLAMRWEYTSSYVYQSDFRVDGIVIE
jgi:hypothetical protein